MPMTESSFHLRIGPRLANTSQQISTDVLREDLQGLLPSIGIAVAEASFSLLRHAGNNRVFEVNAPGRRVIAKQYYRSAQDPRDRLGAEWSLLSYAQRLGLATVPRGLALYEFSAGASCSRASLDGPSLRQLLRFFGH
jgi:hypothetical protein